MGKASPTKTTNSTKRRLDLHVAPPPTTTTASSGKCTHSVDHVVDIQTRTNDESFTNKNMVVKNPYLKKPTTKTTTVTPDHADIDKFLLRKRKKTRNEEKNDDDHHVDVDEKEEFIGTKPHAARKIITETSHQEEEEEEEEASNVGIKRKASLSSSLILPPPTTTTTTTSTICKSPKLIKTSKKEDVPIDQHEDHYYHSDNEIANVRGHDDHGKQKQHFVPVHIHSNVDYHRRGDLPLHQGTLRAYRFIRTHFHIPKNFETDPKFGVLSGSCFEERVIRAYSLGQLKPKTTTTTTTMSGKSIRSGSDEDEKKLMLLVCSYCGDEGHKRDGCLKLL